LVQQIDAGMVLVKAAELLNPALDELDRFFVLAVAECLGRLGRTASSGAAGGTAATTRRLRRIRRIFHEIERVRVSLGVADDRCMIAQLKEADVTVVKLKRLLLKLRAILRPERESLIALAVLFSMPLQLILVMMQQRFAPKRALAIRPPSAFICNNPGPHAIESGRFRPWS